MSHKLEKLGAPKPSPSLRACWPLEVWKKKEHSLRRGFITENEMSCGSPEAKSPQEQIAKAPKAMYTKEIWRFQQVKISVNMVVKDVKIV